MVAGAAAVDAVVEVVGRAVVAVAAGRAAEAAVMVEAMATVEASALLLRRLFAVAIGAAVTVGRSARTDLAARR